MDTANYQREAARIARRGETRDNLRSLGGYLAVPATVGLWMVLWIALGTAAAVAIYGALALTLAVWAYWHR